MSAPTSNRRRMSEAQARERQRLVGQRRAEGASWDLICAEFGLTRERYARDIVDAAVRQGFVSKADLPPAGDPRPSWKQTQCKGLALRYDTPPQEDEYWRRHAACARPGVDSSRFFPKGDDWTTPGEAERAEKAKAICHLCPVEELCRDYALAQRDDWAVLGGTTPLERRALLDQQRTAS